MRLDKETERPSGLTKLIVVLVLLDVLTLFSQTVNLKGEATAWTYLHETSLSESQLGARYIPTLSIFHEIQPEFRLDVEASIRALGIGTFGSPEAIWLAIAPDKNDIYPSRQ